MNTKRPILIMLLGTVLILASFSMMPQSAAILDTTGFTSSFDTGTYSGFEYKRGTTSFVTTPTHSGAYALKASDVYSMVNKDITGSGAAIEVTQWVYMPQLPPNYDYLGFLSFYNNDGTDVANFYFNQKNNAYTVCVEFVVPNGQSLYSSALVTIQANTWHQIKTEYLQDSSGKIKVSVDGSLKLDFSVNSATRAVDWVGFGTSWAYPTGCPGIYFDDISIRKTTITPTPTVSPTATPPPTTENFIATFTTNDPAGGTITPFGIVNYPANSVITVTATPNAGYKFDYFLVTTESGGASAYTTTTYSTNINDDTTFKAFFSSINDPVIDPSPRMNSNQFNMQLVGVVLLALGGIDFVSSRRKP